MGTLNYHDIDFFGEENSSGTAKEYFGEDAIKKAFNNYLMSDPDDFLYLPYVGGLIVRLFHKNMNGVNLGNTSLVMRRAIQEEFPTITLNNIDFIPDYVAGILEVELNYIINETGTVVTSSINILTSVKSETYTYQDIAYVGENLLNFCEQQKPKMINEILGFDASLVAFRWGSFVFINFDQNDTHFEEIQILCNT